MENRKILVQAKVEAVAQKVWYLVGLVFSALVFILGRDVDVYKGFWGDEQTTRTYFMDILIREVESKDGAVVESNTYMGGLFMTFIILALVATIPFVIQAIRKKLAKTVSLTIYEDEISGSYNVKFAQTTLQMPIEKVDNVSLSSTFWSKVFPGKKVAIRSTAGVVIIPMVQNAEEVVEIAMKRIKEVREAEKKGATVQASAPASSSLTEKLGELNALKNAGVISEEEYEKKKADLLSKM